LRSSTPRSGRQPLSPEVRWELVEPLFDGMTPLALISLGYGVVGAAVLKLDQGQDRWLALLYLLGVSIAWLRLWITLGFRARRARGPIGPDQLRRWERLFGAGSMAFGTVLGLFGARTIMLATPIVRELVIALLFGYGAGLVARMSLRPWISLPSLALAGTPPILALLQTGTTEHIILAAVMAVFALGSVETTAYIYHAVRDQVQLRHHLAGLARRDPLTGLPNRRAFEERLKLALTAGGGGLAVLFLDLDHFKPVNDSHGHAVGDTLLKSVGARLAGLLREGDLAARLGGDEFVVLQVGCVSAEDAEFLARRILRALTMPFDIAGHDIRVGVSLGVAVAPRDGSDSATLLRAADAALYRAKKRGRGTFTMALTPSPALAS
jgi:diguanylate cyclase (GGDEF)-like protein